MTAPQKTARETGRPSLHWLLAERIPRPRPWALRSGTRRLYSDARTNPRCGPNPACQLYGLHLNLWRRHNDVARRCERSTLFGRALRERDPTGTSLRVGTRTSRLAGGGRPPHRPENSEV